MEKGRLWKLSIGLLLVFWALAGLIIPQTSRSQAGRVACERLGWFPENFRLKDHSIFLYERMYYIVSISQNQENEFAYARSSDLCEWEELEPVLAGRQEGAWDEMAIWAPYVMEEGGVYYLYYTGVTFDFTQSIMLAVTTDPSDPSSWEPQGVIFQPNHPGMIWKPGSWSDNRDPSVVQVNGVYYLYYTATDENNSIIGLATGSSPDGPWYDWGGVLSLPPGNHPESTLVYKQDQYYYIFYHDVHNGEKYHFGASPGGPWSESFSLKPGWAHEVWKGLDDQTYISYLTDPTITISPLTWDSFFTPPRPAIGGQVHHALLPLLLGRDLLQGTTETKSIH